MDHRVALAMAGVGLVKAETHPVSLRSVPAVVPKKDEEK